MKKVLTALVTTQLFLSYACFSNPSMTIVAIDSLKIMQESQEGQTLTAEVQKQIDAFQEQVQKSQQELLSMQEELQKKSALLNQEAIAEKTEALTKKKKDLERELSDKEESLRNVIQRKQMVLRDKQLKIAHEISQKEQWGMIIDKNTPGVLCVADAIDKTNIVLNAINEKYTTDTKSVVDRKNVATIAKNNNSSKKNHDLKVA